MNNLIAADFNGISVSFRNDAYLNATAIASHFGKRTGNYLKTEQTQEYINALTRRLSVAPKGVTEENQLVIVKKGGKSYEQGTWLHPKLAIHFARWLSAEFAVWCDEQIENILRGNNAVLSNVESRKPLRDAVTLLHQQTGLHYQDCWRIVHQHIGKKAEEMNEEEVQAAINYIHLGLLNSNAFRRELPPPPKPQIVLNPIGYCRYLVASNDGEICHQSEIGNAIVVNTETVRQLMRDMKTLSVAQAEMAKRMRILFGEYDSQDFERGLVL